MSGRGTSTRSYNLSGELGRVWGYAAPLTPCRHCQLCSSCLCAPPRRRCARRSRISQGFQRLRKLVQPFRTVFLAFQGLRKSSSPPGLVCDPTYAPSKAPCRPHMRAVVGLSEERMGPDEAASVGCTLGGGMRGPYGDLIAALVRSQHEGPVADQSRNSTGT